MNAAWTQVGRLVFGALLLANGLNHFWLALWAEPAGSQPLALQLMSAFQHSGLMGVAMAIELAAGVLLLSGVLVPLALCVVMPISTCALYWAVVLEHNGSLAASAALALVLNGLLMFAYLPWYRGVLQRNATTLGET